MLCGISACLVLARLGVRRGVAQRRDSRVVLTPCARLRQAAAVREGTLRRLIRVLPCSSFMPSSPHGPDLPLRENFSSRRPSPEARGTRNGSWCGSRRTPASKEQMTRTGDAGPGERGERSAAKLVGGPWSVFIGLYPPASLLQFRDEIPVILSQPRRHLPIFIPWTLDGTLPVEITLCDRAVLPCLLSRDSIVADLACHRNLGSPRFLPVLALLPCSVRRGIPVRRTPVRGED